MSDLSRREFLRRSALIAAGAVAADQLELLDRLGWVRRFFPAWGAPARDVVLTTAQWDALLMEVYTMPFLQASALLQAKRIPMRNRYVGTAEGWHHIEVVRA